MKQVFLTFFLLIISFQLITEAQSIKVKERKEIAIPEAGEHFFPRFAANDSVIYFTKSYYQGIESINLFSNEFKTITEPTNILAERNTRILNQLIFVQTKLNFSKSGKGISRRLKF